MAKALTSKEQAQHGQEMAMQNRRKVRDLDITDYMNLKGELASYVSLIREGKTDDIKMERLLELQIQLEKLEFKTNLNIKIDSLKYNNLYNTREEMDSRIETKLLTYIDSETKQNTELLTKIDNTKELLKNRMKINDLIDKYTKQSRTITLTREEVQNLFGQDLDYNTILKSGKPLSHHKNQPMLDEFEFSMSSVQMSCKSLANAITIKMRECDELRKQVAESKSRWEDVSGKVVHLLDALHNEVTI